jgi:hypothetical protein
MRSVLGYFYQKPCEKVNIGRDRCGMLREQLVVEPGSVWKDVKGKLRAQDPRCWHMYTQDIDKQRESGGNHRH